MTVRNTQHPLGNGITAAEKVKIAEQRVEAARKLVAQNPDALLYKLALAAREKELADLKRT
jgi:hypothetical protein